MQNKKRPRFWIYALIFALTFACLSGCGWMEGRRVILTTGFSGNEMFRVKDRVGTKQELLVYMINAKEQYADMLSGALEEEDAAIDDVIKESSLSLLSQVKAMCLLAEQIGVSLTDAEREAAAAAAAAYYASFTDADKRATQYASQDTIETMYLELALADKVYAYAIRDVNPEISDDEARTITVELIRTDKENGATAAYEKIKEARDRVMAGEDFAALIATYNEADAERASFGYGGAEDIPEEAAFSLETGEVSDILETETAYYLLRCVSSFDREETRANKARIVEQRRLEAFGAIYDEFAVELPVQLNENAFEALKIPDLEGLSTAEFWRYYETFFKATE